MGTLYIRNVPEDVGERLERLASAAHMSVSAYVLRELGELARQADNPLLLERLPDLAVDPEKVVSDLESARTER